MRFGKRIMLYAFITSLIPLLISYIAIGYNQVKITEEHINQRLYAVAYMIANDTLVKDRLGSNDYDSFTLQTHTKDMINNLSSIDIIVIADMNEIKYTHLDESQIGEGFVNPDKRKVLDEGVGYYSLYLGSQGYTYRRFEPIFDGETQLGFVMVGKYQADIEWMNIQLFVFYLSLFAAATLLSLILARDIATRIKRKIFYMEPEDISRLYTEKQGIIDSVDSMIISLDKNYKLRELNKKASDWFLYFPKEELEAKLKTFIQTNKDAKMQPLIINHKHFVASITPILNGDIHDGSLVIANEIQDYQTLIKEMTGVDQHNKLLRATVHEFKNKLHVILGLLQLNATKEAEQYIKSLQSIESTRASKYSEIKDVYVRAMLISKELIAKEQKVSIHLEHDSHLHETHGVVTSDDINTILGNIMENAFEAFSSELDKTINISLTETDTTIEMRISNNSPCIEPHLASNMFVEGYSTKGENRGYGLAIVTRKVNFYQGTLTFSCLNNHNTFIIKLRKDV